MAKGKRALPRTEKRGPPGPTPLLVIAGLPEATAGPAAATINNNSHSRWRAIASAFTNRDEAIYETPRAVLELGRLACEFAMNGVRDADGIPAPSRLAVAFVDVPGFERLWEVFGHAVWPIPLRLPDWTWPKGRHWRHEIETVNRLLRSSLAATQANAAEELRLRLEAGRTDDILLVPGRNFHLGGNDRLIKRFRSFMSGQIDAADVEKESGDAGRVHESNRARVPEKRKRQWVQRAIVTAGIALRKTRALNPAGSISSLKNCQKSSGWPRFIAKSAQREFP